MAMTAGNLILFGPATAQGQEQSQGGLSGTQSKPVTGIATLIGDGAATSGVVNWIDGVQKPFQTVILASVLSVTAPATIGGVANQAIYSGVGAYGQLRVGQSVTFAGFTNTGNNGTFTINALTTSTIQVTNASSVAETNPAATVAFNIATGSFATGAFSARSGWNAAGVVDTAASSIYVTGIGTVTATTGVVNFSAAPANAATVSVLVQLWPNS